MPRACRCQLRPPYNDKKGSNKGLEVELGGPGKHRQGRNFRDTERQQLPLTLPGA